MTRLNQLACACTLLAFAACSPKEEAISAKPAAEIKGKPIARTPETNSISAQAVTLAAKTSDATSPTQSSVLSPQSSTLSPQSWLTNAPPAEINGYSKIGFDKLASFHYVMPDEISETNKPPADQFPPAIKSLNEKPIALRGFMLPSKSTRVSSPKCSS